jgi:hypothetical protein
MPPIPELPDAAKSEALWTVYWSPRVEQLMEEWQQSIRKIQLAGMVIGMGRATEAKGQQSQIDVAAKLMELEVLKQAVLEADRRVREQVRAELLGRHDGQASMTALSSADPGLPMDWRMRSRWQAARKAPAVYSLP